MPIRSTEQIGAVVELYSKSESARRGEFEIVAFHDSLECSVKIDNTDNNSTVESKLREFLSDERAAAPMRELL